MVHPFFSQVLSIFISTALNSLSDRLLTFVSFISLSGVLFHLEDIPLSHFASLCLVLLGSSPTSPSLVRVILCRRCLVDPNGTIPLSHQSQVLQGCPLCELSMLSCCSWAMITTGTPVDGVYPQAMDYVSHNMGRTTMWFPQGNHRGYDIPPICESPHWGCGSCPDHICAPPTQHSVSSSLYPWM